MDNLNSFEDLDYEYTHNIKLDSAIPPPYDRTLNVCWSRLPHGFKEGEGDVVAALPKDTCTTTQLPLPPRTSSTCHQDPSESSRKAGHWGYSSLPADVSLEICRYIVQQHSTDKPIRLSRWSVYTGLYPVKKDSSLVQGSEREIWESDFFEDHDQALRPLIPYLQVNRRFRAELVAVALLNSRYHLVVTPFGLTTDMPWLAKCGRFLNDITMEFDCTRFYGGKPRTREKIEAAIHSGVFNEQQLKTALAPGKDALESVKHYKCELIDVLKLLTCGRKYPIDRLTIMVRKYWGSRESMPQGYPYFDPTWLNFLLAIPSVLQSNVLNLETIGVPPRLLGLIITKFWGEAKPPTEDAQKPHFTWSPSPSTLWPEIPGQSAAISIRGSVDLTADYLLRLDSPGEVAIHTFSSREAEKEQQSAKKRQKSRRKKVKKSSTLPSLKPEIEPEPVAGHEEQQPGEQAHFQSPSRLSDSSPADVKPGSSLQMESRAAKALGTFDSSGMARFWNERKKTEPDEVSMSSPEKKALHMRRAQEKFAELSKLLEAASPKAPPGSSERSTVVAGAGVPRTGTGPEVPRATLAGGFVPLLSPVSQPATRQQPPSQVHVPPDPSAVPIPMTDGKWMRLTDEDSRPSRAGSTAQSGNGAGDLTDSRDCADTKPGDKDVLGIEECTRAKNKRKKRGNGKHAHSQAQHETSHADKVEASLKSLKDEWSATLGESSKMKQDKKKEESASGLELGCSSKKAENKKAGDNECEKSEGTLTSASGSEEAKSKAGLPQSSQTAQVSPPPPSDLHIAGSCLGNSGNMESGERPGSQSPPELQLPLSSEASIPLPTPWLSMEVPKEGIPNASDEDVKAGEEAKENKSSFPSQDTQVGGIASSKAGNSKEKGKGRWSGSLKPVGEDKKVERKSASRPQPPLPRSETQTVQVREPINQCQRPNYPHVSTKGFKQRPQGQPQRQQPHFHPKGLSTSASNLPPSQQPFLNGPEASALYHRDQNHRMDTLDMLRTMAQVQPMSQAPSIPPFQAPSIFQGQVPVIHPMYPASQVPITPQVPPVPRIPPSSLYSQAPMTHQVPPMSQVQFRSMPQMQPFIHNPYYSQVPTTTMSQVPPIPLALSSQQTNGISNGLIQCRVPIPAQAPNSNAERPHRQRSTTAGDCTRSATGVYDDDDDDGQGKGYPTSFGKGDTSVYAPASGRLNGLDGPGEETAKEEGKGKEVENKPEFQ
ncbi:hypothetical protein GE21DRAFT_9682 [Neurospora crassa]|uniref:Uncharacterized protein n=1 Tax=Neurospora crassa (strain ATCC 24698 / 74-OR23-1A / CBS 708.71 / DSM 1257 / FGSC 987) TaxID=367110 RepID=V5IKF8_NEUCR|nr:hypothetical protein NCU09441 [Neurospora crassa OR74A]ESA41807.1 hypothetical protein NCU09441 [Neurospora crassa OR74A]KHE87231.1 hypothetical protein GE21DRAFT_9682 [Neurospora crassa]|eukprot:XP_011395297.1 hypothetical protein NCU09441 [Neurospora crassa OR74A]